MGEDLRELKTRIESLEKENRELDSRVIELYTLYNISKKLNLATQLDEIFTGTMDIIGKSLEIKDFCIMLVEEPEGKLVTHAYLGDQDLRDVTLEKGEGISGKVVLSGKTILIQDVKEDPDFLFYKGRKRDIGAFLSIPLIDKEEKVLGVLNAHKPVPNSFTGKDVKLFEEVARQIAVAIEKALSLSNYQKLSFKDHLTGLYNRRYFFDFFDKEFGRARRHERKTSLIILDIDHFKKFNDSNGHQGGDMALKTVSRTLEENLRKTDVLVRYGGEEFVVLLPETGKNESMEVTEKLRAAIYNTRIKGEESQPEGRVTATFGVSTFPDDALYATELIDCADKALYYGKKSGRNRVVAYNEEIE